MEFSCPLSISRSAQAHGLPRPLGPSGSVELRIAKLFTVQAFLLLSRAMEFVARMNLWGVVVVSRA